LQGLYSKAEKISDLAPGKLASLEALINKMPTRSRSVLPPSAPLYQKDEHTGELIESILAKYPSHKRVLYFQTKYQNNEPLSAAEQTDLKRFAQLLTRK
jgi:hypothetical protein